MNTSFSILTLLKILPQSTNLKNLSWTPHTATPSCFPAAFNKEGVKKKVVRIFNIDIGLHYHRYTFKEVINM